MKKWVIQLQRGAYATRDGYGMGHTTCLESAKRFRTKKKAKRHLRALLVYRKWTAPRVLPVVVSVALDNWDEAARRTCGEPDGAPPTARIFGEDLALSSIVSVTVEEGPITRRITAAHAHHASALPGGPSQPWGAVRDAAEGSDEEPDEGLCGCGDCEEDQNGGGIMCDACDSACCRVGEPCRGAAGQECGACEWTSEVGEEMLEECPRCGSKDLA